MSAVLALRHAVRLEQAAGTATTPCGRADTLHAARLLRRQAGQPASVIDSTQRGNVERAAQYGVRGDSGSPIAHLRHGWDEVAA